MKLILTVVIMAVAMCCIMWESVVYGAHAPDGPHANGSPGGPACRGGRGGNGAPNATNSTG
ncbi:hypothetical protein L798_14085 [Zootermopsis nevadensis]|uniref:Uncharacterized protein n=1 Tax=Zootermopsis nevadensis TaxID=136037 RepID=A0A067QQD6_ZOONE|nr:hypothetical protein L798_14085 [Zootermopsis nevadensis]